MKGLYAQVGLEVWRGDLPAGLDVAGRALGVRVGQGAVVRVIAFGQQALRGRVAAISPVAVVQEGVTTYTGFIDLESIDLSLRPGMNVEVEIVTEP